MASDNKKEKFTYMLYFCRKYLIYNLTHYEKSLDKPALPDCVFYVLELALNFFNNFFL